jgi:uncharacterized membrane protein YbhN (UPF0104 family)
LKRWSFVWKGVGLVLFVGLFLWASPREILASLHEVDLALLAAAGLCALTGLLIKNFRWKYILALTGGFVGWRELIPLGFISAFFGNLTPGRFGDLWRISFASPTTFSRAQCLVSFFYDRVLDAATMALIALAGVFAIGSFGDASLAAALVLVIGASLASLLFRRQISRLVERVLRRYDVTVGAEPGGRGGSRVGDIAAILATHVAFFALYFSTWGFLFASVGIAVPPSHLALTGAAASLAAVLPISVSGLGTRDAVLLYLLQPFYESPGQVVLAGLLWIFVLGYFVSGLVALPLWLMGLPRHRATPERSAQSAPDG